MKVDLRALSKDGFLKGQDCLSNFPYERYPISPNGCGQVVIYNAGYAAGCGIAVETVYEATCRVPPHGEAYGTPPPTMVHYFKKKHIPIAYIYRSGEELVRTVRESTVPRGILHYIEGGESYHIAFVHVSDEIPACYRFFGVIDGKKDLVEIMEYPRREHLSGRRVVRLLLPGEEKKDVRVRRRNHIIGAKWSEHLLRRCVQHPVLRRKNNFEPFSGIGQRARGGG